MDTKSLSNGVKIPLVGLGTHGIKNDKLGAVVDMAYRIGYRKFDTAWLYHNEEVIGDALRKYHIPREKIFITSKLHIDNRYHKRIPNLKVRSVKQAFENSCRKLGTDYLDLYLIHWPFPHYEKMWGDVVKLYEEGRVRAIGVCSFLPKHIDELTQQTNCLPHVNQYEMTPINTLINQTEWCQKRSIHTEAYSVLGTTKDRETASEDLLGNEVIKMIAYKYKKTPT